MRFGLKVVSFIFIHEFVDLREVFTAYELQALNLFVRLRSVSMNNSKLFIYVSVGASSIFVCCLIIDRNHSKHLQHSMASIACNSSVCVNNRHVSVTLCFPFTKHRLLHLLMHITGNYSNLSSLAISRSADLHYSSIWSYACSSITDNSTSNIAENTLSTRQNHKGPMPFPVCVVLFSMFPVVLGKAVV